MDTLLGHLAQFASFARQGELLCTQGLAYLLRNQEARRAMVQAITSRTDLIADDHLTWVAEAHQDNDGGRPDLEARKGGDPSRPVAKIEAKLGAAFGSGQLRSYANNLTEKSGTLLIVLVPRYRVAEATNLVCEELLLSGPGPWRLPKPSTVVAEVISWEDLLEALLQVLSEPLHGEVVQFRAMYQVLSGAIIAPLASDEDLVAWRDREVVFGNLVDYVTRHLSAGTKVMPMGIEPIDGEPEDLAPKGYRRRYVCRRMGAYQPCFSIGVRDPFARHITPIWLRFHRDTPGFAVLQSRLKASLHWARCIQSGGHIWFPLEVPIGADGQQMLATLIKQAEDIIASAFA